MIEDDWTFELFNGSGYDLTLRGGTSSSDGIRIASSSVVTVDIKGSAIVLHAMTLDNYTYFGELQLRAIDKKSGLELDLFNNIEMDYSSTFNTKFDKHPSGGIIFVFEGKKPTVQSRIEIKNKRPLSFWVNI